MRHFHYDAPRLAAQTRPQRPGGSRAARAAPANTATPDPMAARVVQIVGQASKVPERMLMHPSRCSMRVAAARQLAMYLMHVMLGKNLTEVGLCFGRDRTTVAYACARIEDRRDDEGFDDYVSALEEEISRADGSELSGASALGRFQ